MQYKKYFGRTAVLLTASILLSVPAYAQITEQECARRGTAVVFYGMTDEKNSIVTYTVCGDESDKTLYFIGEASTDSEGKFSVSFSLEKSGDYVLKMKDIAGNTLDKPIAYLNETDNGELLTAEVNSGEEKRMQAALDELDFRVLDKTWLELKNDKLEAWVIDCVKRNIPYADYIILQKDCAVFTALYEINNAKAAVVASECGKYAEFLELSQNAAVMRFSSGATDAQKRALVQKLSSSPAASAEMLANAIADVMKNTGSQGGTGSGGSGSGGGGGGLVGVQAPLQNNIDSVDENNQPSGNSGFSDLDEAEWARDAVETLAEKGVISGDGDGRFRPNDTVTREEFVKMLMEASGIASEGVACPFVDVFKNDWFYSYVGAARQAGIVNGLSDSIFGVGLKISRQDAAVMINRAADYVGKNLVSAKEYTSFSDEGQIAEYAADAVRKLYECGVINGMEDGSFRPYSTCTRAEAAKMIYGLL